MNSSADSSAPTRTDIVAPASMTDERIQRRVFTGGLLALVVASWSYLLYQDWAMRHMDIVDMAMPGAGPWSPSDFVLVFVMWAVMMVAMMLPSVLPTLRAYRAVVSTRDHQRRPDALTAVFAAGYVFTWTIFSAIATLTQSVLHAFTLVSPAMRAASPSIAGALLIGAGVYQWTPSKRVCLAQCASPLQFILRHWRPGASGAWRMGIIHGGCCWMLMALLFVYGMMNLAWIMAIAMYVLSEKLLPAQGWLPRVVGALLILWGGTVLSIAWH
jgi:predicted metal-binding membrane protein